MLKRRARQVLWRSRVFHAIRLERTFLRHTGWTRSVVEGKAVDRNGRAIPWMNYSVIEFLANRLPDRPYRVFEWGTGNSTLWWAERASEVVACEHDKAWAEVVQSDAPPTVTVVVADVESPEYLWAIGDRGLFDIVVVDGRRRSECAILATEFLTTDGIIVWDNVERDAYVEGVEALTQAGYANVQYWGLTPLSVVPETTGVFYRRGENLLGL